MTLVELTIIIALTSILAAIIAPLGRSMIIRSHAINCSQNLRQIGMASMLYAGDNHQTLPQSMHQKAAGGNSWRVTLQPYASGTVTFKCKEDPDRRRTFTYVLNDYLTPRPSGAPPDFNYSILAKIDAPQATLMFAEASTSFLNSDHFHFAEYYGQRMPPSAFESQVGVGFHGRRANYLFADGHVETLSWIEVQARLSKPGTRFLNPSGI